jgi:hypothetical protein
VPEINLKSLESAILEVSKCGLKVKIKLNNQDHTRDQAKQSRSHQRSSHFSAQNYAAGSDISWK